MLRTASLLILFQAILAAYPNGSRIPTGNAGEPGTGTPCASCHSVTLNPTSGSVKIALPGENSYVAGTTQRWTVTVADNNSALRTGFQLTATGGSFKAVSSTVVTTGSNGRQYVSHSGSSSSYSLDWTPPSDGSTVTVYVAGAAASGTRSTNVYTLSLKLSPAGVRPTVTSPGVVNSASYAAGISSGSWVSIFGRNLAPSGVARTWTADEIVSGKLPTALEGTTVKINGKPAAISYISETQLNVQAPEDSSLGSVAVEVTTSAGTSDSYTAQLRSAAPGFFRFAPSNNRYVAAVFSDGAYCAPPGLFGTALNSRAAQPGEVVILFGTGFGATDPAVPAGSTFSGAAPLASGNNLTIRIGGIAAEVQFAGLSGPGLYQFNVIVPAALVDGEHLVEASVLGSPVPTEQYLAVKR